MPEWNFLVVRHFGGRRQRQELCARIKSEVEDENLSHLLPLVKYEPSRGLEYYLGLAYDASDWDAEDEARHILVAAGIGAAANPQQSYTIAAHQVQTLLRGSLEFESFTVPIHYERVTASEMPSTAELLARDDSDDDEIDSLEAEKYARLLYWCSAIGAGGLDRVKEACTLLGIDTEWGGAWSVLRRLALLGHLDISDGQSVRWGVLPPMLVTPALDVGERFLIGQRSPALRSSLLADSSLYERYQPAAPARWVILRGGANLECYGGTEPRDAGCLAGRLSELLPDRDEWLRQLPSWEERDFARYFVELYNPAEDAFGPVQFRLNALEGGLYRFTLERAGRPMTTLALYDCDANRWVAGDYYGLRFLARSAVGACRAFHDEEAATLVLPVADRWPMPYERALVLASGRLPRRMQLDGGEAVVVYKGIPQWLAIQLCGLLSLEMESNV
jgi:hypothetical protein